MTNPIRRASLRLGWLIRPGESLGAKAANAGAWAFGLNMTNRLLTTVRTVVLANLLTRSDFGLMGIAMLVIGFLTSFTQTGFNSALVQNKRGLDETYLNTAWTIEALRGLALAGMLVAGAPLIGDFFGEPMAADLARLLAVGVGIAGFVNTGVIAFDKDLDFQRRFVFRAAPNVVDLVVSVIAAIILRNAWALAFGWVAGRIAFVIASYIAHPHRPRLLMNRPAARSMFGFGIWTLASQILIYFTLNIDDIVVGRIIDAAALGLYQMAFTMSQLTTTEITTVVNQVAFPTYSRLQDEPKRLGNAYVRTLQLVTLASFPVAAGLWFVGPTAVRVFLSEEWVPMIPAFTILLLWGLIRSILATTGPLFRGVGRPGLATRIQFFQLVILAAIIYPATSRFGIEGAAWATVVAAVIPDIFAIVQATRVSTAPASKVAKAILFPGLHSIVMLVVLWAVRDISGIDSGIWLLVWAPILGSLSYLGAIAVSRRLFGYLRGGILPPAAPAKPS